MSLVMGNNFYLPFQFNETDLLAGTAFEIVAPCNGYLNEINAVVQKAVTTGGDVTVEIATVAVTGLVATIADAATKGTVVSDTATAGTSTRYVEKGDRITVTPAAAFATAGALNGHLLLNTAH